VRRVKLAEQVQPAVVPPVAKRRSPDSQGRLSRTVVFSGSLPRVSRSLQPPLELYRQDTWQVGMVRNALQVLYTKNRRVSRINYRTNGE